MLSYHSTHNKYVLFRSAFENFVSHKFLFCAPRLQHWGRKSEANTFHTIQCILSKRHQGVTPLDAKITWYTTETSIFVVGLQHTFIFILSSYSQTVHHGVLIDAVNTVTCFEVHAEWKCTWCSLVFTGLNTFLKHISVQTDKQSYGFRRKHNCVEDIDL